MTKTSALMDFFDKLKMYYSFKFKIKMNNPRWVESINVLHTHLPEFFPEVKPIEGSENSWEIVEDPLKIKILKNKDDDWTFNINLSSSEALTNAKSLVSFMAMFYGDPRDRTQNIVWISNLPFKFEIMAFCEKYTKGEKLTETQFREVLDALNIKNPNKYVTEFRPHLKPEGLKQEIERVFFKRKTQLIPISELVKVLNISNEELLDFLESDEPSLLSRVEDKIYNRSKKLDKLVTNKIPKIDNT